MIPKGRVLFLTLGCKVNQYDTQILRECFENRGFISVGIEEKFDICIVNTCTVTKKADIESIEILKKIKNKNPCALIFATGCFVKDNISEIENLGAINFYESEYYSFLQKASISKFSGRTRAFVKVQDGCNFYCSYCRVPYVRGRSRSKNLDKAIEEIKNLIENEYKEVVLTGINLGAYGEDLEVKINLCSLIKELIKIPGEWRLRLSSIDPVYVTDELISLIKEEKICKHLHIPLQSGDDDILEAMNRKYRINDYERIISEIKEKIKDVAITTDIIVGFSGETEDNFKNTCNSVEKFGFARVHIFTYSERKGTLASSFKNMVSKDIVERRFNILNEIVKKSRIKYMNKFLGKELKVLVERDCPMSLIAEGYSENYIRIYLKEGYVTAPINKFVKVKLNDIDTANLIAHGLPVL